MHSLSDKSDRLCLAFSSSIKIELTVSVWVEHILTNYIWMDIEK